MQRKWQRLISVSVLCPSRSVDTYICATVWNAICGFGFHYAAQSLDHYLEAPTQAVLQLSCRPLSPSGPLFGWGARSRSPARFLHRTSNFYCELRYRLNWKHEPDCHRASGLQVITGHDCCATFANPMSHNLPCGWRQTLNRISGTVRRCSRIVRAYAAFLRCFYYMLRSLTAIEGTQK